MKNKKYILILTVLAITAALATAGSLSVITNASKKVQTESIAVRAIGTNIVADGTIHSQNEATLHFPTGGKLTYLPFKEGDTVYQGQTIAQLDIYPLQKQLSAALNAYRITRDTFDQTQDNVTNGIVQGQQKANLEGKNLGLTSVTSLNPDDNLNTIVNDIVKRIVDQNQANLDNSVIQVQLANYAMQLATITSPIDGIILHEDVTTPNIIVSPANGFTIVDPSVYVFKANVPAQDIDFIRTGAIASVTLTGNDHAISGTVIKVYPQKITLANGQEVYQVDVQSDDLKNAAYGQSGTVIIASSNNQTTILAPTWTILGNNYVWVAINNKAVLQKVTVGKVHENYTELVSGVNEQDKIITNPMSVAANYYQAL